MEPLLLFYKCFRLQNCTEFASVVFYVCTLVRCGCIVGLTMSRRVKWASRIGMEIFFAKTEFMATLVRYNFFVLHIMMASPPLSLLSMFKRSICMKILYTH